MRQQQLISSGLLILLLVVCYQVILIFSPFAQSIFWSAVLAFAFYPIYEWLVKKQKLSETWAALVMSFFLFVLIIPPVVWTMIRLIGQAIEFVQAAILYMRDGRGELLILQFREWGPLESIRGRLVQWEPVTEQLLAGLVNAAKWLGNMAAQQAAEIPKNLVVVAFHVFLTFCLVYACLVYGKRITSVAYQVLPLAEKNKRVLFKQINDTLGAVVRGQLLTALAQSVLAGFIFFLLGIPYPLLFGALTFLTSLIPVAGAAIVWMPLVIYLIISHAYVQAVILFILGVCGISIVDNILKPLLIGEKTKLPYLLLFLGILGGIHAYGLIGVFLAPIVLSLFFALLRMYREQYTSKVT